MHRPAAGVSKHAAAPRSSETYSRPPDSNKYPTGPAVVRVEPHSTRQVSPPEHLAAAPVERDDVGVLKPRHLAAPQQRQHAPVVGDRRAVEVRVLESEGSMSFGSIRHKTRPSSAPSETNAVPVLRS